ncbi:MAG TPA: hypothetical protein DDW94_01985 [Deltaproteobacteria bacterium]|nr:MAG: hypothetical protein A2Z79_12080 [Deltaproteobacteria bacterium GWA2_55_82]OGQ65248.1 MAG: hypothetical protein A3I81_02480 [Deltaproteobacteria bacterium RIFCSPLOWO2_02_FULL_55_12]OIJ74808.1 MAG: hypothetical protein A2V21_311365 [Deltaproteobacteria bacterium GWC2_55_46]HBG45739.1 hypothetical protein [Deltaproteobacteria bacterium]HCY11148.1 hypothetical protein [Deltaproteobacteria bacterium]
MKQVSAVKSSDREVKYLSLEVPRKILLAFLFLLLFLIPALSYAGDGLRKANSPDYWIGKLKNPDKLVLTPEEIAIFNRITIENIDQMAELSSMPEVISGERVFEWLWDILGYPAALYDSAGQKVQEGFFNDLAWNMYLDGIAKEIEVRFGVIVERADVRGLPTEESLRTGSGRGFDTLQYSSIYPPEKVALLHTSRDGRWGFFQTRDLRGWIRMDKVAFGERDDVLDEPGDFLVVTGSKVKVYGDYGLKEEAGEVAMSGVLALAGARKGRSPWAVKFPVRGEDGALVWTEAYISPRAGVHRGYLPYTRRNIIRQAFKMLGEEYGWGGREGLRDCSLFIQDLFATVGLRLPRNSRQQGSIGDVRAHLDEYGTREDIAMALREADPGVTLLTLNGHVMLHIGISKGKPFVIHQIFAYADRGGVKRIGRVAVTGLELGGRSPLGPMKKRLRSVNRVTIPAHYGARAGIDKEEVI